MRLQLIAALVLLSSPGRADPSAEASIRVYADDDDMTVVSPSARAEVDVGATTLEAGMTADVVSGASIDVVTSASPTAISERRVELGLGATRAIARAPALTLSSSLHGSFEADHEAFRAEGGVRVELHGRQLALEARYTGGRDAIGTVVDPAFERTRVLHQVTATASVILDPRTIVDVIAEGARSRGYHASPYRRVPLVDPAWPTPMWLAEEVPALRRSVAGAARLRRALGADWFGLVGYRGYVDDWSIASHTVTLEARRQLGERVLAGAALRGYHQGGADFYRATYVEDGGAPRWRTRDRTLGPMRTLFGSLTADVAVGDRGWRALVAGGVLASWFPDFPAQADRHALLLTLSLSRSLGGEP